MGDGGDDNVPAWQAVETAHDTTAPDRYRGILISSRVSHFDAAAAVLIPLSFIVDIFFGRLFLHFPNGGATLGILVTGHDPRTGWDGPWGSGWEPVLPLEEFAFYALGFVTMLLVYV